MLLALRLHNIACEIDERVLFNGLSATFAPGDLIQILGPNGAGKTTLLKIITGLSQRYRGELSWGRFPIPSYEFYACLLYLGHATGVKTSLTPLENLAWYFGLNGSKGESASAPTREDLREALRQVGLAGYEDVPSYQMSAGQQRRVALARLYVSQAPLWVLDEPFTAIDRQGVASLEQHLDGHRRNGGIVILTSHQSLSAAAPTLIDLADYAGERA